MKSLDDLGKVYGRELGERRTTSKIYSEHQLIGLELAQILNDNKHKALYIRLAKKFGKDKLLPIAKSVAERHDIQNKGAYFMSVLYSKNDPSKYPINRKSFR